VAQFMENASPYFLIIPNHIFNKVVANWFRFFVKSSLVVVDPIDCSRTNESSMH
jgi:hypothetical protein